MQNTQIPEIVLTDDTLENIKIMAPFLDEASQNQVFGIMLGTVKRLEREQAIRSLMMEAT